MTNRLQPDDFVAMDWFEPDWPVTVDLVYARADHPLNIFKTALYNHGAQLWLHKDLARVVLRAANRLNEDFGWRLVLYDGLRPVEAQQRMHGTDTVRLENPAWSVDGNPYLSLPGQGGHPRGMAVDLSIEGADMGSVFDDMTPQSARDYAGFDKHILDNRNHLEMAMGEAAAALHLPLVPLPSEWWDYRFPKSMSDSHPAVCDAALPPFMRLCEDHTRGIPEDWQSRFDKSRADVLNGLAL